MCSCKSGCTGSGKDCTDINECDEGTHNCPVNSACANIVAGFTCKSNSGYSCVAGEGATCRNSTHCEGNGCSFKDIDECTDKTHNCPATEDGNNVYCANTIGGFQCKQKVIDDENCEMDEEGKIIVDYANGWKYRGTGDRTNGIVNAKNADGFCKPNKPCTVGSASYAPYCYLTTGSWDYCKCKSKFDMLIIYTYNNPNLHNK